MLWEARTDVALHAPIREDRTTMVSPKFLRSMMVAGPIDPIFLFTSVLTSLVLVWLSHRGTIPGRMTKVEFEKIRMIVSCHNRLKARLINDRLE